MNIYVKQIVIEKNGKITESLKFDKGLSVVKGSAEIYDIIKLLLGIKEAARSFYNIRFLAVVEHDKTYYIRGNKNKGDLLFDVSIFSDKTECTEEYFDTIKEADEINSSLFFHRFKRQDFPHKLFRYRDLLKYYPNGDFSAITNGYGITRSFRGFITDYIKHFKPIKLREDKDLFLKLSNDGEFTVKPSAASVDATVIGHGKDKKIIVYKYKPKKGYHKKQGHRQPYTKVKIEKINL